MKPIATKNSFKICEILNVKPLDFFSITNDLKEICEGYIDEEGTFILTSEGQDQDDSGYWISYAINHPESVEKSHKELMLLQYKYISYLSEVFGVFNYISINEDYDKLTLFFSGCVDHPGKEITIDVRPEILKIYKFNKLIPYKQYSIEQYWGEKYPQYNTDNPWCVVLGLMEEVKFKVVVWGTHTFEGYISNENELIFTFKDPHLPVEEVINMLINKDTDVVVTYLDEGEYDFEY